MDNSDNFVGVDLNNVHYTKSSDAEYSCDEDVNDVVSSGHQTSNDEDDSDNDDDGESVGAECSNIQVVVGDKLVSIDSITSDEIRAMEFGTMSEAYDFYYWYGKCTGFAIRKSDVRRRGPEVGEIVMRQYVCIKHGLRDKKHLARIDKKRDHKCLTRNKCAVRLRVHYKAKKDRYAVSVFEEGHNHELTPLGLCAL
ncbi:unnamed protein product [Lathyrus sativus]|nr:unnamed protein product [Lathyrus sativus]